MKTMRFISGTPPLLFADQYENAGRQRQDACQHAGNRDGEQHRQADHDQINGQQQHPNVFSEVHGRKYSAPPAP